MVNFQGGHTPHPEIDTSIRRRDDYPQSLWNHPEPNPSETVNLGGEGLSNGDVIDPYLDAHLAPDRRIEIPEGEYVYQRDGHFAGYPDMHLVGLGEMGDVVFDQGGQSGREDIDLQDPGVCVIENITVEGYADYRHDYGISAQHPDAELIMKRFRVQDGVDPSIGGRGAGFYLKSIRPESPYNDGLHDGHSGCLRLLWCRMTRSADNNNYVDGPIVNDEADGQVIVVGGEQRYGNISILRIGHHGATVYGTRITAASSTSEVPGTNEYYQQRGIWVRQPNHSGYGNYSEHTPSNTVIDECEFFYPSGAGGGGIFVLGASDAHGSGVITRCRVENNSDVPLLDYASGNVEVYDSHAYGSGDLNSDLTWQGSSEIGSSADPIDTDPWWGLALADVTPPRNLTVVDTTDGSISVEWDAPDTAVFGVQQYNVYLDDSVDHSTGSQTTSATIDGLDAATTYTIGVSAVDGENTESGTTSISVSTDALVTDTIPIGGGYGYPDIFQTAEADYAVSSRSGLESALDSASAGDVVFVEGDASIGVSPSNPVVVPAGVILASNRGFDGDTDGGLIYTADEDTSWTAVVQAQAGARITGLRIGGPLDDQTDWVSYSDARDFAALEAAGSDVEVDNCIVRRAGQGILDGRDSFEAHHNTFRSINLEDDGGAIVNNGANPPHPIYEHNLFERCTRAIIDEDDGGFIARHNIVEGPVLDAPFEQNPNGGTTTTVENNTIQTQFNDQTGQEIPSVRIVGNPSDEATINRNHFHDPDDPFDDPSPGDEDRAIVQIDLDAGEHVDAWNAVTFSDNHYGDTSPPDTVGAIPIGSPSTIGRPRNLTLLDERVTEIDVEWDEPENTGAGIKEYNIYIDGSRERTVGAATTAVTIGPLDPGTEYFIEVTAVDEDDFESAATSITGTTEDFTISQPQNFTIDSIGYNQASVSWDPPAEPGAGVSHYRTLLNQQVAEDDIPPEQTSATFDGLSSETSYTFYVQAYDEEGNRSQSASVTGSTDSEPDEAPDAPGFEAYDVSASRVAFAVTPPESRGSAPLSHYRFFQNGEFSRNISAESSLFVADLLEPSTRYQFGLSAVNDDDYESSQTTIEATTTETGRNHGGTPVTPSSPSCGFGDVLAETPPEPVENLEADETPPEAIVLSWSAPPGGVVADHYVVYVGGERNREVSDTTVTISGLAPDTEYLFEVSAVDEHGNESGLSSVTARTELADIAQVEPQNFRAADVTETSITLAWDEPPVDATVDHYILQTDYDDSEQTTTSQTATYDGLDSGETYGYAVTAVDDRGVQSQPAITEITTLDLTPEVSLASAVHTAIEVTWTDPADVGNIEHYNVYLDGSYSHYVDSEYSATVVPHLTEDTEYTVGIAPVVGGTERDIVSVTGTTDSGGWNEYSIEAPPNLKAASPDEDTVEIAWNHPSTALDVPYYLIGENGNVDADLVEVQPRDSRYTTFEGLSTSVAYEFAVAGLSNNGSVTDVASTITGTTGSNPPQNIAFPNRTTNHVDVTWDPPED